MAKEDFCFTYYDGDAARDKAHMTRLERGAYDDIISAQRKRGHLSIDDMNKVLSKDFEACWPSLEWVLLKDEQGKFYIEWVDKSIEKMRRHSKKQTENGKKGGRPKNPKETQTEAIGNPTALKNETQEKPLGNEDGDEYGNFDFEKESQKGKTFESEMDVDLIVQKVIHDPEYRMYCEGAGYPPGKLEQWMEAFNRFLKFKGKRHCREDMWRMGFPGWMNYHNYQNGEDPEKYNPVVWSKKKKEDYDKIFKDATHQRDSGKPADSKSGTSSNRTAALKNW